MATKAIDILKANGGSINPIVEQQSKQKQATGSPSLNAQNPKTPAIPIPNPTSDTLQPSESPATTSTVAPTAVVPAQTNDTSIIDAVIQKKTATLDKTVPGADIRDKERDGNLMKQSGLMTSLVGSAGMKATQDKQAVDSAKSAYTEAAQNVANKFQAIDAVAQRYGATADNDGNPVFQTQEGLDAYRKAVDSYTAATAAMKDAYDVLNDTYSVYDKTIGDYKHLSDLYKKTDTAKTTTAYKAGKITRESVESELSKSDSEVDRLTASVSDLKASRDDITAQINNLIEAEKNAFPPMSADRKAANDYAISQLRGQLQSINARLKDAENNLTAEKKNNGMLLAQQRTIEGIEFSDGVEAFKPKYDNGATPFVLAKEVKDAKDAIAARDFDLRSWQAEVIGMVQNGTMTEEQYNSELAKRKAAMEQQNAKTEKDLAEKQKQLSYAWSLYLSDATDAADFKRMSKETDEGKEAFMRYFRGLNISTLYGDFSDEYKTFNYIYNTEGADAAEAYLDFAADGLAQKSGAAIAEDFDMPVVREGFSVAHGLTKGMRGVADAINLLTESDPTKTNAMDYAQNMMLQSADAEDRKFAKWLMEAGDSFGNMAPGMLAGAINPIFGQIVFGASAAGNAYKEYRDEGVNASDAGLGGVLRGLSEVFTQKLLGGLKVPGFSGIFTGKLAETLGSKVGSAAGKAAIDYGVDILSEVVEENAQNYIEAAINLGIGAADKFEAPTWDDFVDTTMSTFLMTGIMNAPSAVSNAKTIKTSQEFTKQYVNPWIDKTLDSDLAGYSNTKAFAEQLKESIADGEAIDPQAFQAGLLQALNEDAKRYGKGGEARLATAQEQADFRADQIEQNNPKATVERSAAVQSYINTGKVNLDVAKQAGEVLDGIASGDIKSENISDNQIDKLHLTQPFGVKATSEVLGVEIKKAASKSEARATFRATLNNIEQNKVATEQTNTAQIEQTMDSAVAAESNLATAGEKTASIAMRSPMQTQAAEQTMEAPTAAPTQIEAAPAQEIETLPAPTIRAASENAMSFSEFRKQFENDKTFRRKYSVSGKAAVSKATQLAAAYEKYKADVARTSDSSGAMTRSEFARDYIADNSKASDTDIDLAYQDYLENNDMERLSDTVSENVATLDNDVSGLVQNEYSEMIPAEDAESIDALCKLLDRRMVVDDLGDSNGEWSADGDIKIDAAPEHSGAKSAFVFVAAHEIGHDVKSKISKDAWTALEDSAISAKGENAVSDKQASNEVYSDEAIAREDVACDFIGELLSDKDTLDTFLRSIEAGEQTENLTGIRAVVAATKSFINKITGKQKVNADTEALVQRVQDAFGTDIETARKAVDAMQKAVTAAMKANKNATEDGGVRYNKKDSLREGLISDKMEKDYSKRLVHEVTGEIREGDGIILDDSEKAAIASNLKTGNGHLVYGKDSGYVFSGIVYLFDLNSNGSVTVTDYLPIDEFVDVYDAERSKRNEGQSEEKAGGLERISAQPRIRQSGLFDNNDNGGERTTIVSDAEISEQQRISDESRYSGQSRRTDAQLNKYSKKSRAVSETPTVENYSEKTGMDLTTVNQVERAVERAQQRDAVSEEVAAESVKAADKAVDDALKAGAQKKQMVLPSKAEAERISQRAEATLQRAAEESFFRGLAKTAAAQKVNDEVKAIKAAERAQKKAEAVKAQYDKKIDNLKAQLEKTKKQSELESAFRKDAEKYNERLSREVDRANERTEKAKDSAANKESNLKQKLTREKKQSELESAFRKDAEKQGRALQREIDRLTKQRDRLVRAIQKDALMSAKSSKDAADAIRNWRRKSNIGEAALSEQEVDTRILNAKEQEKLGRGTSPKMRDRLKSVSRQLAYYFSSDVLPFEEMGRLQDRLDSVDTRITGYRNAGSSVNAILTDCLRAPDGSVIDDRSVQAILGCWKDGKVGGKIDEARQQLFDRYLYHMHNIDRMGAEPRARAAMQAFLEKHPEYKQYALDILQKDGTIKQKNLTIKTYDVIEAAENGDAVAQEYIDLAKAFANAKNKAVFGSGDGRVLSAKTSEVIAKQMEAENPWLADKANEFYSWWDKFMQAWYVGVQGTESQYEAMKKLYPHYVPTYRAFKKTGGLWAFSNNGINARDAVRKAKGSIQDLNTVGDNIALQIERIVKGAREAELFSNVYEEVMNDTDGFREYAVFSPDEEGLSESVRDMYNEDAVPDARDTESFTKDGDAYTWTGYFNGEKRSMLVSKRVYDSLRALTGASASTLERGAIKAGNTATAPMKTAITGVNVAFATRNIPRDFTTAIVNSIAGLEFPKYYVQSMAKIFGQSALSDKIATAMMKAVDANISENERTTRIQDCLKLIEKARVKGSKEWSDFVALGGTGATYARSETGFLWNPSARGKVGAGFNRALSALGAFNEVTESMTRFAEYLATIDKYGDTAEGRIRGIRNAAEVTVDFSRHGRVSKVVNSWAPYWNPAIQGMAKIYRSIRFPGEGNKLVGIDAWKQRGKTFARGALAVGIIPRILQFALLGLMGGRDDWDELNDRAKDTYFMIPLGDGKFVKIPYNRDWGQIFGSTFSRIVQGAQGREDNWREFWDAVIVGNFDPTPNFIGITQALELKANEDFAGRAIVPRSMDGVERTEQYDEETSWLAKQLAKTPIMAALDLSPVQIDYLLSGYFGDYADMFIEATDADGIAGLEGLLTDVIGNTFTADNAYSSATMGRYYDVMDEMSKRVSTAKFKNPDGYQDLMDYKIQQAISSGFGGRISELNKQIRETENEDEKRVLKFQAQDIAKEALAFYRRCVDGEISDPVRYIKYDGYGENVRDELIRLSNFEDKDEYDYQYTPSDSVPNLGGHKNTDDEKAAYKDIYAENYKAFASDIIASDRYAKASDEEKVGMLEGARELASFYAKKEWATEFNLKGVNSKGKVTYDPSIAEVSASKMFDGKIDAATVGSIMTGIGALEPIGDSESVTSLQKWQYIASRDDITDEQKEIAIRAYMADGNGESESELEKCNRWTKAAGITAIQYVDIQGKISDLKPTNGRSGITDVQKAEVIANYKGISKNSGWKLLQQMFNSKSNESRKENIIAAQKMGDITPAQYVSVWKKLSEAKGVDMNNDGKNESGSEKWAKMQIIFSLNVSNKTKELLWKSEVDEKTNIWEFYNKYKKKFG